MDMKEMNRKPNKLGMKYECTQSLKIRVDGETEECAFKRQDPCIWCSSVSEHHRKVIVFQA